MAPLVNSKRSLYQEQERVNVMQLSGFYTMKEESSSLCVRLHARIKLAKTFTLDLDFKRCLVMSLCDSKLYG